MKPFFRSLFVALFLISFLSLDVCLAVEEVEEAPPEILQKYLAAEKEDPDAGKNIEMDVVLDGKLPKLKKEGKMAALRKISTLGKITYKVVNFWGDDTIKKELMARYLTAETQAKTEVGSVAIIPQNYSFKSKGIQQKGDRQVFVFEIKPREKRVGLFKGEIWLDPKTGLPIREAGRLVKNPSIFFKKVDFVREYELADGRARTSHFNTVIDTRVAGKAELDIRFNNYREVTDPQETEASTRTVNTGDKQ